MRHILLFSIPLVLLACTPDPQSVQTPALVDPGPDSHITYSPGDIDWQPGPGSFEQGSEYYVLEGDPGQEGVFTMRIKLPDGFTINPHWHPNVERVTVLSGTFHLGSGEEVAIAETNALQPGTYTSMPPEMRHFAIAEDETVIQLTSVGPWLIHYVNPEDDPRNRE